jgi:hypothetical protein
MYHAGIQLMLDQLLISHGFERSERNPGVFLRDQEMVCLVCPAEWQAGAWLYFRDCLEISAVSGRDAAELSSIIGAASAPTALAA